MSRHIHGAAALTAAVLAGSPISAAIAAEPSTATVDQIFITASPLGRFQFDVIQGTSVLADDELAGALRGSIGETLANEPGVSSTFFGPISSRPIVRGFDGDRIRVLFDGIGSIDASSVSPDHESAGDAMTSERIEILRGPATLLYGTSAVGGVINIIDGRIPMARPQRGYGATGVAGYAGNARERFGSFDLDVAVADGIVVHGDGGARKSADYHAPGFSGPDAAEAGLLGRVPNSDGRTTHGTGGVSYIWDNGLVGASVGRFTSNYGSPSEPGLFAETPDGEPSPVRIDLQQTRVDLKGEVRSLGGFVTALRGRAAYGDYSHVELEGSEHGTTFNNRGWEARAEAVHAPLGSLTGVIGVQYRSRDFAAVGEEAFVPATTTEQIAGFVLETLVAGPWRLEAGARLEGTRIGGAAGVVSRTYSSTAVSGAVAYEFLPDTLFGVTGTWTERPPTAEELFSNGPHLATNQFERGNPTLREEGAVNLEATLRRRSGRVTGSLSVYRTWYDRFILAAQTAEMEDGLPVFEFAATDARFTGLEAELAWRAIEQAHMSLTLDAGTDLVRARDVINGADLPRIPPVRYRAGASLRWQQVDVRMEVVGTLAQRRVAPLESATAGYAFLNTSVGVRPFAAHDVRFVLQCQNLTNARARAHTSFIKDAAPLPGRDIRFFIRVAF